MPRTAKYFVVNSRNDLSRFSDIRGMQVAGKMYYAAVPGQQQRGNLFIAGKTTPRGSN